MSLAQLRIKGLMYATSLFWLWAGWRTMTGEGIRTFIPIIVAYTLLPLIENIVPEQKQNLSNEEEKVIANDPFFDLMIYLMVPIQFFTLFLFLNRISSMDWTVFEFIGLSLSMGLMCGVLGINVAHELGHRNKTHEIIMAKLMLMTSLYMHFYVEHNKGHHRNVGTENDPATARKGESLYAFWIRCVINSFRSAWEIEKKEAHRRKESHLSFKNPMMQFLLIQTLFVVGIALFFGPYATLAFVIAAIVGFLHLETVNYIEHYGLSRQKVTSRRYEDVQAWHSWNSNKIIGRMLLFELSRHSDHHHRVDKKYQTLSHLEEAPSLPLGYPGAMLLSMLPPLWFRVVDPLIPKKAA